MFKNLFKAKKQIESQPDKVELSDAENLVIAETIEKLNQQIAEADSSDLAQLYDQLGENEVKRGNVDAAITAFEKSLEIKEQFGSAYNNLLNLYETKRQESAQQKDNEALQKWVTKTDDLLAISKRVMKSSF